RAGLSGPTLHTQVSGERLPMRVNFAQEYRQRTDDDLQRLAEQFDQLVPEAQQALRDEMRSRDLRDCLETARTVEAEAQSAASGPQYLVVTSSNEMPGWLEVIVPRQDLRFPETCPCGKMADTTSSIGT